MLRAAARLAVNAAKLQGKEPDARAEQILAADSGKTWSYVTQPAADQLDFGGDADLDQMSLMDTKALATPEQSTS